MQLTYCKCKLRHTGNLAIYPGNSLAHTDRTLNLYNLSGQLQRISRNHLLLELGIIDACKICSLALPLILTKNGNCTCLRQSLNNKHSRHHRISRKMSHKMWLIHSHILLSHTLYARLQLLNRINEKKRTAVRQNIHNLLRIHN